MKVGKEKEINLLQVTSKRQSRTTAMVLVITIMAVFITAALVNKKGRDNRTLFPIEKIPVYKKSQKFQKSDLIIFKSFYITRLYGSLESSSRSKISVLIEELDRAIDENKGKFSQEEIEFFVGILDLVERYREVKILREHMGNKLSHFWLRLMIVAGVEDWEEVISEGNGEMNGYIGLNDKQLEYWENVKINVDSGNLSGLAGMLEEEDQGVFGRLEEENDFNFWFLKEIEITKMRLLGGLTQEDHLFLRIVQKLIRRNQESGIFTQKRSHNFSHLSSDPKHDYFLYLTTHPLDTIERVTSNTKRLVGRQLDFLFGRKSKKLCRDSTTEEEYQACWQSYYKKAFPNQVKPEDDPGMETDSPQPANAPSPPAQSTEPLPPKSHAGSSLPNKDYGSFSSGGIKFHYLDSSKKEVYFTDTWSKKRFYAFKDSAEETGSFNLRGNKYHYLDRSRKKSYFKVKDRFYIVDKDWSKDYNYEYRNGIKHYYFENSRKEVMFAYRDEVFIADADSVKKDDYYRYNSVKCWYVDSWKDKCIYEVKGRGFLAKVDTLKKAN